MMEYITDIEKRVEGLETAVDDLQNVVKALSRAARAVSLATAYSDIDDDLREGANEVFVVSYTEGEGYRFIAKWNPQKQRFE